VTEPEAPFSLGSAGGTLRKIAVSPAAAFAARPRLWGAIEQRFPVRFVPVEEPVSRDCDAQLVFADYAAAAHGISTLRLPDSNLAVRDESLDLTGSPILDARLRNRRLTARWTPQLPVPADEVLGETADGRHRVWVGSTTPGAIDHVVAAPLPELESDEVLRDRLSPGGSLAGLALVQFLRSVCTGLLPTPPGLRASIVVDDPNLRWRSYGRLDYREIVSHAVALDYHLAVATIPLDLRITHGPTLRLFREHADRVSLAVHGNNHARRELADTQPPDRISALIAQAARRVRSFELRTGLSVSRVMAPPHEACGREAMRQLVRTGFESATLSRAFSWIPIDEITGPYTDPDAPGRAAGFDPAEVLPNGLPAMIRRDFSSLEDALTMAFLDQPVLVYGHEPDFADHLALIESVARTVNGLGDVRWCDLQAISRSNYSTWQNDTSTLHVQPFARRVELHVPEGISRLVVEPLVWRTNESRVVERACGDALVLDDALAHAISLDPETGGQRIDIGFAATDAVDPNTVDGPHLRPDVVLRRIATEGRDRLHAFG
jgi:hypothetical protein